MKLGIFGGGFLYSLAAATLGAVILVSIAHLFGGGPLNRPNSATSRNSATAQQRSRGVAAWVL